MPSRRAIPKVFNARPASAPSYPPTQRRHVATHLGDAAEVQQDDALSQDHTMLSLEIDASSLDSEMLEREEGADLDIREASLTPNSQGLTHC